MYNVTPVPSKPLTGRPRLTTRMSGLLLAALLLTVFQIVLVYLHIPDYNTQPKNDFNLFLKFGRYVLDGQTPYQGELPFIYQLWVSFLYLPFVPLNHDLALHSWAIVNLALLAGAVGLFLASQTFSADYRWFYSQDLGLIQLVFSFKPPQSRPASLIDHETTDNQ